jgi:hypothetical protein
MIDINTLVTRYNNGATYEELALDCDVAPKTMRRWLSGKVESRSPGGQTGKQPKNRSNAPIPERTDAPTGTGKIIHRGAAGRFGRRITR